MALLGEHYGEPHRAYHNWHHIEAMLRWMNSGEFELNDAQAVYGAILFHDAIYDPASKDNEELSAQLAETALAAYLPAPRLRMITGMIRATAMHQMIDCNTDLQRSDMAHFLDMDLSILGADWQIFETYEHNIRKEYSIYPDALFWPGRARILQGFLNRDRLFFSEWGFNRFEAKARSNLMQSIEIAQKMMN
ncbi:MAG: HD domain-containing protein [Sphingorhabdus sp.]